MTKLPQCTGTCRQGRTRCDCQTGNTELANAVPLDPMRTFGGALRRGQLIRIQPTVTGGRIPRRRRVRRFLRQLWDLLTAPCFRP